MVEIDAEALLRGTTPGPWVVYHSGKVVEVQSSRTRHRKPIVKWTGFDACDRPLREQAANAQLAAAAPDLARQHIADKQRIAELERGLRTIRDFDPPSGTFGDDDIDVLRGLARTTLGDA